MVVLALLGSGGKGLFAVYWFCCWVVVWFESGFAVTEQFKKMGLHHVICMIRGIGVRTAQAAAAMDVKHVCKSATALGRAEQHELQDS